MCLNQQAEQRDDAFRAGAGVRGRPEERRVGAFHVLDRTQRQFRASGRDAQPPRPGVVRVGFALKQALGLEFPGVPSGPADWVMPG
jgi:hypothetical protein